MNPYLDSLAHTTRRHFLKESAAGLGAIALSAMLGRNAMAAPAMAANPLAARLPHFAPKAKRVIYLHLTGSPPNLDLFDHKPELVKRDGQDCPDDFIKGRNSLSRRASRSSWAARARFHSMAGAASGCRTRSRICRRWRTISASSTRCTPTSSTTRRQSCCFSAARRGRAGRRWARGSLTGSAPRTRISRATSY